MRDLAVAYLIANLASVASICGAVALAYYEKAGWGWLIFAAICLHTTLKSSNKPTEKDHGNSTHTH